MPYLITGATGPVGRSIVTQLRNLGQEVRIVTRDICKAPVGVEAVQGDFTKGDLPERSFEGAKRVFLPKKRAFKCQDSKLAISLRDVAWRTSCPSSQDVQLTVRVNLDANQRF